MKKSKISFVLSIFAIALITLAYFNVPTMAQPGDANDPLVTRRYVDDRIAQLEAEITALRSLIAEIAPIQTTPPTTPFVPGNVFGQAERDALFHDFIQYFESVYGDMLRAAGISVPGAAGQIAPFQVLNVPPGSAIRFQAGAEFILRAGSATALAGENGLVDVTGGRDVQNGEVIDHNHLMLIPATDGRGIMFQTNSWIMIRGDYYFVN